MANQLYVLLLLASGVLACSSAEKKDPLLEEAAAFHQQATEIQEAIEPKIEQIDSLKTVIEAHKLSDAKSRIATLDSLKEAFDEWEENLVEVPGMEHSHNHGSHEHEHHHHADATLKDLPANQMRDLQQETLKAIQHIQSRLDTVLQGI